MSKNIPATLVELFILYIKSASETTLFLYINFSVLLFIKLKAYCEKSKPVKHLTSVKICLSSISDKLIFEFISVNVRVDFKQLTIML